MQSSNELYDGFKFSVEFQGIFQSNANKMIAVEFHQGHLMDVQHYFTLLVLFDQLSSGESRTLTVVVGF